MPIFDSVTLFFILTERRFDHPYPLFWQRIPQRVILTSIYLIYFDHLNLTLQLLNI